GVVQVLIIFGAIALGYFINSTTYPAILVDMISASTSWDIIAIYALFSFTGYLLYLFIYAALGSLVSKVEDVGSAVSSVTIVFIIAYFVATTAMTAPDLIIVRISSYIPFISLFTTPIRYMLTTVSAMEIIVSISLMIAVTAGVAYLSVYIYRKGSLNYGNKMSLLKMFKKQ
ncbi:MAG: ABC transporter permease, partial [Erysipelothrix sp.]|nr:ABC transporter permease [Erysipelothrix sp.]